LKYCGGCRAQYNRLKTVEEIKKRVGDALTFVSPDDEDVDMILVVTGCKTACVDISPFDDYCVRFVKNKEDAEQFISEVKKRQGGQ
jgi:hypothetical protein